MHLTVGFHAAQPRQRSQRDPECSCSRGQEGPFLASLGTRDAWSRPVDADRLHRNALQAMETLPSAVSDGRLEGVGGYPRGRD